MPKSPTMKMFLKFYGHEISKFIYFMETKMWMLACSKLAKKNNLTANKVP